MDKLTKTLTKLLEFVKASKADMPLIRPSIKNNFIESSKPQKPKPSGNDGAPSALPTIKAPNMPSMIPPKTPTKIPGIAPDSRKNPRKIAEQIKDGSISTKTQQAMLKQETCNIAKNGQWSLEKAKPVNPKDPVLNDNIYQPKAISPERLKKLQLKLESYLKNKTMKKDEVQPSDETTSEI